MSTLQAAVYRRKVYVTLTVESKVPSTENTRVVNLADYDIEPMFVAATRKI